MAKRELIDRTNFTEHEKLIVKNNIDYYSQYRLAGVPKEDTIKWINMIHNSKYKPKNNQLTSIEAITNCIDASPRMKCPPKVLKIARGLALPPLYMGDRRVIVKCCVLRI